MDYASTCRLMCGRYFLHSTAEQLAALFGDMPMPWLQPRFNIAPTQPVPIVRDTDRGREMALVRWGLIPGWSKGPDNRYSMINARLETVASKPAYRAAFRYRRCLVPADGFYEWQQRPGGKQPHVLRPADGSMLALAGLWEHWQGPDGSEIESCTILVREANAPIGRMHDRMPVVVSQSAFDLWLDPKMQSAPPMETLLAAQTMPELAVYPVGLGVNNPRNDDPDLIEAIKDPT